MWAIRDGTSDFASESEYFETKNKLNKLAADHPIDFSKIKKPFPGYKIGDNPADKIHEFKEWIEREYPEFLELKEQYKQGKQAPQQVKTSAKGIWD